MFEFSFVCMCNDIRNLIVILTFLTCSVKPEERRKKTSPMGHPTHAEDGQVDLVMKVLILFLFLLLLFLVFIKFFLVFRF